MKIQFLPLLLLLFSCTSSPNNGDIEQWKAEIMQAEQDFNELVKEKGAAEAFTAFAANDGVIKRGETVIKGRDAISKWYAENNDPNSTLTWKPDFIDVSQSGDLAYTYGAFVYTYPDSTGAEQVYEGIFHSIWKRQPDGQWKFVWD